MTGTFEDIVAELQDDARQTLHAATNFAAQRGEDCVDLQHWLHQMLIRASSDLERILHAFDIEPAHVEREVTDAIERFRSVGGSKLDFSASNTLQLTLEQALVQAKRFGDRQGIRIGHVILALVDHRSLRRALPKLSPKLAGIDADVLNDRFLDILSGQDSESREGEGPEGGVVKGKQQALEKYTIDLTADAADGRIDPVVGRDDEIRQAIDILMRRRQNNPLLVGEAGVGKTAVVEGLALRIANHDVPPMMKDVRLLSLDLGLLQAGAGVRGEFEQRLKQVIDEVQASALPIILFIDEAHTLIGAGGTAGTGDAANLLKPALARGELRTIAATTWSEYKKHIENDAALTRRFQTIAIDEPDDTKAILMLRGLASTLEAHHKVMVLDEAIEAAVKLSHRYIHGRQLPDKAVSVLDTACSRVAVSLEAAPSPIEDTKRRIEALTTELGIIEREASIGVEIGDRQAIAEESLAEAQSTLDELEARFDREKSLVDRILTLRTTLTGEATEADDEEDEGDEDDGSTVAEAADSHSVVAELRQAQADLKAAQGERPLIWPAVDSDVTAAVVGDWTGIPIGRMVRDEIDSVLGLAERLRERVVGQDHALDMIAKRVQTARASLENPSKPKGVFLLCGPSGVGKTETALALADVLYGGEHHVISINMSEFQESHTVSTLKGAPPGYKGFEEGGRLTEAVRRKPYSVVLLDEVEKAHPDVHEIFFQVFDKGMMDDSTGQRIDFKNTIILLTSNVGTDVVMDACADQNDRPGADDLAQQLREPLLKVFPPALLGRLVVIPYYPLNDDMLNAIIRLQLGRIEERMQTQHGVPFDYDQAVVDLIGRRCTEVESGGRMIDAILTNSLLPRIGQEILLRLRDERPIERVEIGVDGDDFSYSFD